MLIPTSTNKLTCNDQACTLDNYSLGVWNVSEEVTQSSQVLTFDNLSSTDITYDLAIDVTPTSSINPYLAWFDNLLWLKITNSSGETLIAQSLGWWRSNHWSSVVKKHDSDSLTLQWWQPVFGYLQKLTASNKNLSYNLTLGIIPESLPDVPPTEPEPEPQPEPIPPEPSEPPSATDSGQIIPDEPPSASGSGQIVPDKPPTATESGGIAPDPSAPTPSVPTEDPAASGSGQITPDDSQSITPTPPPTTNNDEQIASSSPAATNANDGASSGSSSNISDNVSTNDSGSVGGDNNTSATNETNTEQSSSTIVIYSSSPVPDNHAPSPGTVVRPQHLVAQLSGNEDDKQEASPPPKAVTPHSTIPTETSASQVLGVSTSNTAGSRMKFNWWWCWWLIAVVSLLLICVWLFWRERRRSG